MCGKERGGEGMRGRRDMHGGGALHGRGMRVRACVARACMAGGGGAWQDRRPLEQTVRILLECILVK